MEDGQYAEASRRSSGPWNSAPAFSRVFQFLGECLIKHGQKDEGGRGADEGLDHRQRARRPAAEGGDGEDAHRARRTGPEAGRARRSRTMAPGHRLQVPAARVHGGQARTATPRARRSPTRSASASTPTSAPACWTLWFKDLSIKVINELRLDLSSEFGQDEYDKHMREFMGFERPKRATHDPPLPDQLRPARLRRPVPRPHWPLARGDRVVVRGPRGVEFGEVLVAPDNGARIRRRRRSPPRHGQRRRRIGRARPPAARSCSRQPSAADEPACRWPSWMSRSRSTAPRSCTPCRGTRATRPRCSTNSPRGSASRCGCSTSPARPRREGARAGCGKPGCGSDRGGCSTCGTGGGCSTGSCSRGIGEVGRRTDRVFRRPPAEDGSRRPRPHSAELIPNQPNNGGSALIDCSDGVNWCGFGSIRDHFLPILGRKTPEDHIRIEVMSMVAANHDETPEIPGENARLWSVVPSSGSRVGTLAVQFLTSKGAKSRPLKVGNLGNLAPS